MGFESVKKVAEADFPTRWGAFRIFGFEGLLAALPPCDEAGNAEKGEVEGLVALVMGDIHSAPPLVRIHSQCLTGDVFGSLRCDCRLQLELALGKIAESGAGILLYETLIKTGFARGRYAARPDDGLELVDCMITNAVRCAPPGNKPLSEAQKIAHRASEQYDWENRHTTT